jgi:hypothetical protein
VPLTIEVEQEEDGRWLAEVPELPGVLLYGQSRQEAIARVQALYWRVGMSSSAVKPSDTLATGVTVSEDTLAVELDDGRTIAAPLAWFPRLLHGTADERRSWRLIAGGRGIHWPALDEDISVANLLLGQPSGESQASFKRWLALRSGPSRGRRRSKA